MKSRVVVLGSSTFQRGLLSYLELKGYEVHVVTNRPRDPGIKDAYYCHELSYTEKNEVLQLFASLGAVQVFSAASDVSIYTQAFIQNRLGLPGHSPDFIQDFTDKEVYKRKLSKLLEGGLPRFVMCRNKSDLLDFYWAFTSKGIIVKPKIGSGSNRVKQLKTLAEVKAYQWPEDPSEYLVEEYVEGREFGGDFGVYQGEVIFYHPTLKAVNPHKVPVSHLVLENPAEREVISAFLQNLTTAASLPDGIYNADIIVDHSRPFLIDLAPRLGGNCLPELMYLSTGVNEWRFVEELLTGQEVFIPEQKWLGPHGVYIIGSSEAGKIKHLTSEEHPFGNCIIEVYWRVGLEDEVQGFTEGGKHLGYVLYKAENNEALIILQKEIESFTWFTLH